MGKLSNGDIAALITLAFLVGAWAFFYVGYAVGSNDLQKLYREVTEKERKHK